ncbi:MAG: amylo-alpha-1,6-glucosidase [Candidatus Aminicenantaceae bacterium]
MKKCTNVSVFLIIFCIIICWSHAEIYYPWKEVYVGALDAAAWNGLVFVPHNESGFALRFKVEKGGQFVDKEGIFFLVSEVGPNSPDGSYARIKMDLSLPFNKERETPILIKPSPKSDALILEWSRQDEKIVVGKIKAPKNIKLHLIHYIPWNLKGNYRFLSDGHLQGRSSSPKTYHYVIWTHPKGKLVTSSEGEEVTVVFSTEKEREVCFVAGVGEDERVLRNRIYRYKNKATIESFLEEERDRYRKKRVKIDGLYKGIPEAITNNLFWMVLYQSGSHRFYTPAGRRWIFPKSDGTPDHWTIFEWDSFFNALELSVESSKHAEEIIRAVLETQYPNGSIPNWRGRYGGTPDRSQPPVGSYVVLKLFQKLGGLDFIRNAYPYLKKWHSFWKAKKPNGQARRDGNGDGLLEWGTDVELVPKNVPPWEKNVSGKQRAMWESGQDDLPNWDKASFSPETGTLTMNCLDLSCLYTLDAWCLAQIANFLNKREDYRMYLKEYEEMKNLINTHLWDDIEEFYFDRHWDGEFSSRKAASNFYPWLARIPDEKRARKMLKHLLDPKEFWGDYVIPSISRDDPAFKDQQYWRGTIWPPTNYLVYQGLKAYGYDVVASEFAKRSSALFLRSWENFQICPENYDSRTGQAGGQRHQSWGPLFALIALEEYLDFTPWEGFRFGTISPEKKGKLSRIFIQGRHYEVEVSSSNIKLREEGREIIKTNGGAVIRQFLYTEQEISFGIKSLEQREIEIKFLTKGRYQFFIDDELKKVIKGDSVKFKVPQGSHSVLILLLEKED